MYHGAHAFALGEALHGAAQARELPRARSTHGDHMRGRHPCACQLARRRVCLRPGAGASTCPIPYLTSSWLAQPCEGCGSYASPARLF